MIRSSIVVFLTKCMKHANFIDNRSAEEKQNNQPEVVVRLIDLADFAVKLKAQVWTSNNDNAWVLKCDVMKSVFDRFNKEGIEVPFPYRTIVYKKDIEEKITV